jgi:3D-(3,5/4)-trihydroxycyclohexane-1,2-dione acylhydrolase (decyclizing)
VHAATAYAKVKNRLQTFACLSSIGPGATNMITGAATATINRLPVLLLPGDIFARRNVAPVLQQLESSQSAGHLGQRLLQAGEQVLGSHQPSRPTADRAARSRCVCSPARARPGAVTLALPQDVQTEAYDYPVEFFRKRVWRIAQPGRPRRAGEGGRSDPRCEKAR